MLKLPLDKLSNTLHLINIKSNNQIIFTQGGTLIQINGKQMCAIHFDTPLYVLVLQTSCITYDIYLINLYTLEILLHHKTSEFHCRGAYTDDPHQLIYTVFIDNELNNNSFHFTFHLKRKSITKEPIYIDIPITDSFVINYFNQHYLYSKINPIYI